jgi:predicted ferric reductase
VSGANHRELSFVPRDVGTGTVVALPVALAGLWLVARPGDEPVALFAGQLIGAEAVLLFSIGLVLVSTLPWVEHWFDGIDRAAIWHRRLAIVGTLLLPLHVLVTQANGTTFGVPLGAVGLFGLAGLATWAVLPRWQSVAPPPLRGLVVAAKDLPGVREVRALFGGYDRWRALHRTTGLFVAAGFLHGVLDGPAFGGGRDPSFGGSAVLRWSYVAIGGVGVAFYVYRELLAHLFLSLHDYRVDAVTPLDRGLVEVALRPIGRPMRFVPGQFAMVFLEAKDGWHRHPFTIASGPQEPVVRFTIKALGDWTSRLGELVEPGMPAVIGGPHGRFSHLRGTPRQVWVAGGVGIAPFLSWLRAMHGPLPHRVDLFYSSDGEPPFGDEVRAAAGRDPALRVHLVDTRQQGRLTVEQVLAAVDPADRAALSVFMCGPEPMLRAFTAGFREAGLRKRRIHREHFDWR